MEQWAHWGEIFRQTCNNEKNFFTLAIEDFQKYDIVSEGNYTISPYVNDAAFLAADTQGGVTISTQSVQVRVRLPHSVTTELTRQIVATDKLCGGLFYQAR